MSNFTTIEEHPCPICGGVVETLRWSDHYDMGSVTSCRECNRTYDPKKLTGAMGLKAALEASVKDEES